MKRKKKRIRICAFLCAAIMIVLSISSCTPSLPVEEPSSVSGAESSFTSNQESSTSAVTGSTATSSSGSATTSGSGSIATSGNESGTVSEGATTTATGIGSATTAESQSTGTTSTTASTVTSDSKPDDPGASSPLPDDDDISDDRLNAYSYRPQITEIMPAVHIKTTDGSNSFATDYSRGHKLSGQIDYVDATVSVSNCEDAYLLNNAEAEVKVRGNYTLEYPKKPIRIKFGKKQSMVGLHDGEKYKNWVLLADWKDLSMANNTTAFYLGNTILGSDGYYCTDYRNVELYINGTYWGVYLLVEQQEVKDGRTSVPEVDDGYTGTDIGYLFEYDGYYVDERNLPNGQGDPTFEIGYNGATNINPRGYTVKSDINSNQQLSFLQSYVQNVYKIAHEAVTKGNHYAFNESYTGITRINSGSVKETVAKVIDLQSLVDMYILYEISCDPDIDAASFFMTVDMSEDGNKKLTFEAPWDFDSAFGIKNGFSNSVGMYASVSQNPWLSLFKDQPWFWEMVREKWNELKQAGVLDTALSLIEEQKTTYEAYYMRNFQKWEKRIWDGNGELVPELNSYITQRQAADYLYNWLEMRFAYLDSQWGDNPITDTEDSIPEGATAYRFEAEYASFGGGLTQNDIRSGADRYYASNSAYVGNLSNGVGKSVTFTVNASEDTTAYLFASVAKREIAFIFNNWFSMTVNGKAVNYPQRTVNAIAGYEENWHTFTDVMLTSIDLTKGKNTITFTVLGDATNFDYCDLYSTVKLT